MTKLYVRKVVCERGVVKEFCVKIVGKRVVFDNVSCCVCVCVRVQVCVCVCVRVCESVACEKRCGRKSFV